jgi:hypothetical protein
LTDIEQVFDNVAVSADRSDADRGFAAVSDDERAFAAALALLDLAEANVEHGAGPGDDFFADEVVPRDDDDEIVAALTGPAQPIDLAALASVRPADLGHDLDRLHYLQAIDRLGALLASLRADALVAFAGARPSGAYLREVHLEREVAVARRTSHYGAGRAIEVARCLATTFPGFARALRDGEVSEGHCSILVDRTRPVVDAEALARIEARVLPKAKRLTVGEFGREVAKAVVVLDPDAEARFRRAREQRRVWSRPLDDGLGFLGLVHDWPTVAAIAATLESDAAVLRRQRGGAAVPAELAGVCVGSASSEPGAAGTTLDECRADALAARVLGTAAGEGAASGEGAGEASVGAGRAETPVSLDLVIDLATLRGEADGLALLAGEPVPAGVARELAEGARSWRRFVTDPVTGHLLDVGTKTYLPGPLRQYVLARDGGCRAPGCTTRAASRLQMDHAVPFPEGPSSAANCGGMCTPCHQVKTAGYATITGSAADGSCTWTTSFGQRVFVPPRPFLDDPPPPRGQAPPC